MLLSCPRAATIAQPSTPTITTPIFCWTSTDISHRRARMVCRCIRRALSCNRYAADHAGRPSSVRRRSLSREVSALRPPPPRRTYSTRPPYLRAECLTSPCGPTVDPTERIDAERAGRLHHVEHGDRAHEQWFHRRLCCWSDAAHPGHLGILRAVVSHARGLRVILPFSLLLATIATS